MLAFVQSPPRRVIIHPGHTEFTDILKPSHKDTFSLKSFPTGATEKIVILTICFLY